MFAKVRTSDQALKCGKENAISGKGHKVPHIIQAWKQAMG